MRVAIDLGLVMALAFTTTPSAALEQKEDPKKAVASAQARKAQLVAILGKAKPTDDVMVGRVVDELMLTKGLNAADAEVVVDALKKWAGTHIQSRFLDLVAAAGSEAVRPVLKRMETTKATEEESLAFLVALGRLGPAAKEAAPVLRKMLKKEKEADRASAIRVVLANIDGGTAKEREEIAAEFRQQDRRGFLWAILSLVRPREWLTAAMIADLKSNLEQVAAESKKKDHGLLWDGSSMEELYAALGTRAKPLSKPLQEFHQQMLAKRSPAAYSLALALARIDPAAGDDALQKSLKVFPELLENLGEKGFLLWFLIPQRLVDADVSIRLAKMLEDRDPTIAEGARISLAVCGLTANGALPETLRVYRNCRDENKRLALAALLAGMANFDQLPLLEELAKNEPVRAIRESLRQNVVFMRTLEVPNAEPPGERDGKK